PARGMCADVPPVRHVGAAANRPGLGRGGGPSPPGHDSPGGGRVTRAGAETVPDDGRRSGGPLRVGRRRRLAFPTGFARYVERRRRDAPSASTTVTAARITRRTAETSRY